MNTLNLDSTNAYLSSSVPSMRELTLDEMDEVGGGWIWAIPAAIAIVAIAVAANTVGYNDGYNSNRDR